MKAIHYTWAWLIDNGSTDPSYDYYADGPNRTASNNAEMVRQMKESKWGISAIGVDWSKTAPPCVESFPKFTDTNPQPATKYRISGALWLKNGEMQPWIASSPEPMELLSHIADNEHLTNVAKTLFGEI